MKLRLKLKHKGKTRVFVGKLKEEASGCKCNNDCYDAEEQRKLWVKMMAPTGETSFKKVKSCYTCFFRGPDGGPDIGPHTTCLDCCRLNKWKERVNI